MAWGAQGYFPVGYQPYQPYQPYQTAAQMSQVQQGNQSQSMTPPTIHAEIIQVEDEQAALNYPVGAGASQMMIARDESAIFVKTATANGQATLDVFSKRPRKPVEQRVDLSEYVRRDEIEPLVAQIMASQGQAKVLDVSARKEEVKE